MPDAWDPAQYEKFAAERAQPFWDLVGLSSDRPIGRAVDLGCGTGELTAALAERLGIAEMIGIDSSPAMLGRPPRARPAGAALRARRHRRRGRRRGDHDLVFANASLQWVPDHAGVVARWWAALRAGRPARRAGAGQRRPPVAPRRRRGGGDRAVPRRRWAARRRPTRSPPTCSAPEQYAILLDHLGAARQHVRLQVYGHVLGRSADVVEWVKGTSLTRFVDVLPAELHERVRRRVPPAPARRRSATRRRTSTRSSGSCSGRQREPTA